MNKNPKIISIILSSLLLCLVIVFYIFAQGWQEPPAPPPGGNVPSPLNTGPVGQAKKGGLIINWLGGEESTGLLVKGRVGINMTGETEEERPQATLDVNGDTRVRNLTDCGKVYTDEEGILRCGEDDLGKCLTGNGQCEEGYYLKGISINENCEIEPICEELPSQPQLTCDYSGDRPVCKINGSSDKSCTQDSDCDCKICDPDECVLCSETPGCNPEIICPEKHPEWEEHGISFDFCQTDADCVRWNSSPPGEGGGPSVPPSGPPSNPIAPPPDWSGGGGSGVGIGAVASGSASCESPMGGGWAPGVNGRDPICGPSFEDYWTARQEAHYDNILPQGKHCDFAPRWVLDDCPISCKWFNTKTLEFFKGGGGPDGTLFWWKGCLEPPDGCNPENCIRVLDSIIGNDQWPGNPYCMAWFCPGCQKSINCPWCDSFTPYCEYKKEEGGLKAWLVGTLTQAFCMYPGSLGGWAKNYTVRHSDACDPIINSQEQPNCQTLPEQAPFCNCPFRK